MKTMTEGDVLSDSEILKALENFESSIFSKINLAPSQNLDPKNSHPVMAMCMFRVDEYGPESVSTALSELVEGTIAAVRKVNATYISNMYVCPICKFEAFQVGFIFGFCVNVPIVAEVKKPGLIIPGNFRK